MHVLVSVADDAVTEAFLVVGLFSIDSPAFNLLILEPLYTLFFTSKTLCLHGVGPVLDAGLGCAL